MLYIVVLLVHLLLGLGEKAFSPLVLLNLDLGCGQLTGPVTVHLLHLRFASLGSGLLLGFLFLSDAFGLLGLGFGHDNGRLSHASDVGGRQDGSFTCGTLACLLDVPTHLPQFIVTDDGTVGICSSCCRVYMRNREMIRGQMINWISYNLKKAEFCRDIDK